MSHYQSYLRAVSNANKPPSPSPPPIIRKQPANYSTMPNVTPLAPYTPPSINGSVYQTGSPSISSIPQTPVSHTSTTTSNLLSDPPTSNMPSAFPYAPAAIPSCYLSQPQISAALQTCLNLQTVAATQHGKRPFAALLLGPDKRTPLLTHFSISHVQHAESELARLASLHFSIEFLSDCTLVSTWEPCVMCAGTIYWSGIGHVLYAASEEKLRQVTGNGNKENLTMSLPCREVFKTGQRTVEVIGPVTEEDWEAKVIAESEKWWNERRTSLQKQTQIQSQNGFSPLKGNGSGFGYVSHNSTPRSSAATTWTGEESIASSLNEDGEYTADLDIDWMR